MLANPMGDYMAANSRPRVTASAIAVPVTRSLDKSHNRKIVALLGNDGRRPCSDVAQSAVFYGLKDLENQSLLKRDWEDRNVPPR